MTKYPSCYPSPSHSPLTLAQFLTRLTTLLTTTHSTSKHSLFLSQKPHPQDPSRVLLRATNGASKKSRQADPASKIKLSTLVELDDVAVFYQKYSEVCKKGMEGLRKRDKKKAKAKKKGKGKKV